MQNNNMLCANGLVLCNSRDGSCVFAAINGIFKNNWDVQNKTTNRTCRVIIFTFRLYYSISFELKCTVRTNKFKKKKQKKILLHYLYILFIILNRNPVERVGKTGVFKMQYVYTLFYFYLVKGFNYKGYISLY